MLELYVFNKLSWNTLLKIVLPVSFHFLNVATGKFKNLGIDEKTVETVADIIFLGSKITADGDYSHEIKRHLLLGRKVMKTAY